MVSPVQENVHRQAIEELLELFSRGCDTTTFFGRAASVVAKTLDVDYAAVLERASEANDLVLRAGVGWNENLIGTVVGHAEREALEEYARSARLRIRDVSHRFSVPLFDHVGGDSSMAVAIGGRGRRFGLL